MNKKEESEKPKISYGIGDIVVIKSYPKAFPLTGDPLHIPPIMVVVGVEIENKKKKTHDNELGKQISERIKYNLIWFDNKKSDFVDKIMYQSFLEPYKPINDEIIIPEINFDYRYGEVVSFRTTILELAKDKTSKNKNDTKFIKGEMKDNVKEVDSITSLVTFSCPELVISGIRKNDKKDSFDDFGNKNKIYSEILIKVMWFNPNLQKYSEYELPQECLNKLKI